MEAKCKHCNRLFTPQRGKPATVCPDCIRSGHWGDRHDCKQCAVNARGVRVTLAEFAPFQGEGS
jgi:hypothetical protein